MKDKFDIFNNIKVDINEYEEIKFDDNTKIKNRIKSKLNNKKRKHKKIIIAASLIVAIGGSTLFNNKVWADLENIWYSIGDILNIKNDEVSDYKYNINKVAEDKDVKILFRNIMLDDGRLLIDVNVDYSKFDPFKGFTKKQQKDWEVKKWGDRDTTLSIGELNEVYVDGVKLEAFTWGVGDHKRKDESKKNVDVIMEQGINAIEKEEHLYEKISKEEFPYKIDKNRTYNFKIKINKLHLEENYELYYDSYEDAKKDGGPHAGVIRGNWEVNFDIKGSDLVDMSKTYNINEEMDINVRSKDAKIEIKDITISPVYIKLKYKFSGINNVDADRLEFKIMDEKNNEAFFNYMTRGNANHEVEVDYRNIFKDYKELKIVPYILDKDRNIIETYEDKAIIINTENR